MRLVDAPLVPKDENVHIKKLELQAQIAQGRLLIAQLSAGIRKAKKELLILQNTKVEVPKRDN
jgi:hypothetical protein